MKLLIVESPNKCKTIKKYLGEDWIVKASMGHITDLPKKELGIDKANKFKPAYEITAEKKNIVKELGQAIKHVGKENVYLATDEDREGEAISYHLCKNLGLDYNSTKRVTFNEITESVVKNAVSNPRTIDIKLVAAQEARRVIDRLVGYEISPILWKKISSDSPLSAGRVQSVAVKLIVERERSIENFKPESTLKLTGKFETKGSNELRANSIKEFDSIENAKIYMQSLDEKLFFIKSISKVPKATKPQPPFSTSTLQQDANKKLGFSVENTMQIAQKLYEGGHISYMRTDSVNLSDSAIESLATYIEETYGVRYVEKRKFKNKNLSAQEAHEAIRPANFEKTDIVGSPEEKALYNLIYLRAVASQMKSKETMVTTISINTEALIDEFQAKATLLTFDGFTKAYSEVFDEENSEHSEEVEINERLNEGDAVELLSTSAKTNFTKPKSRFGEAELVKELETLGIGRPATYASIIKTIKDTRKYVGYGKTSGKSFEVLTLNYENKAFTEQKGKINIGVSTGKLLPNEIAYKLVDFLEVEFKSIMDYEFTARCENNFDLIAQGKDKYQNVVKSFDDDLNKCLDHAQSNHADIHQSERKTSDIGSFEGKPVSVGKGDFGVYIRFNNSIIDVKDIEDPETITLDRAINRIKEKKAELTQKKEDQKLNTIKEFGKIKILKGTYGPYITNGKDNAPVPKYDLDKIDGYDELKCKEVIRSYKAYKKKKAKG